MTSSIWKDKVTSRRLLHVSHRRVTMTHRGWIEQPRPVQILDEGLISSSEMLRTLLRPSTATRTITPCKNRFIDRRTMAFQYKPNTEPPKEMTVFRNLTKIASDSAKFRRVLWTGRNSQVRSISVRVCTPILKQWPEKLVIMTIPVSGEIGEVSATPRN